MRKKYTLKVPRFQPMKNIVLGPDGILRKECTKCKVPKTLTYENWCIDSQRESGFKSQCRQCGYDYHKNRKLK